MEFVDLEKRFDNTECNKMLKGDGTDGQKQ